MTSNTRRNSVFAFGAAGALMAGAAAPAFGAPMSSSSAFVMPFDGVATMSFQSSNAGATGKLYYLGEESDGAVTYTASNDSNNLGKFLFNNKQASPGASNELGLFTGGTKLHFAYLITSGVSVAPTGTLSRSDQSGDLLYFDLSAATINNGVHSFTLSIEDVKNPNYSDFDYNDAIFTLSVTPQTVPSPGSIALACLATGFVIARRRDRPQA